MKVLKALRAWIEAWKLARLVTGLTEHQQRMTAQVLLDHSNDLGRRLGNEEWRSGTTAEEISIVKQEMLVSRAVADLIKEEFLGKGLNHP
jgi:hypothetical protein